MTDHAAAEVLLVLLAIAVLIVIVLAFLAAGFLSFVLWRQRLAEVREARERWQTTRAVRP